MDLTWDLVEEIGCVLCTRIGLPNLSQCARDRRKARADERRQSYSTDTIALNEAKYRHLFSQLLIHECQQLGSSLATRASANLTFGSVVSAGSASAAIAAGSNTTVVAEQKRLAYRLFQFLLKQSPPPLGTTIPTPSVGISLPPNRPSTATAAPATATGSSGFRTAQSGGGSPAAAATPQPISHMDSKHSQPRESIASPLPPSPAVDLTFRSATDDPRFESGADDQSSLQSRSARSSRQSPLAVAVATAAAINAKRQAIRGSAGSGVISSPPSADVDRMYRFGGMTLTPDAVQSFDSSAADVTQPPPNSESRHTQSVRSVDRSNSVDDPSKPTVPVSLPPTSAQDAKLSRDDLLYELRRVKFDNSMLRDELTAAKQSYRQLLSESKNESSAGLDARRVMLLKAQNMHLERAMDGLMDSEERRIGVLTEVNSVLSAVADSADGASAAGAAGSETQAMVQALNELQSRATAAKQRIATAKRYEMPTVDVAAPNKPAAESALGDSGGFDSTRAHVLEQRLVALHSMLLRAHSVFTVCQQTLISATPVSASILISGGGGESSPAHALASQQRKSLQFVNALSDQLRSVLSQLMIACTSVPSEYAFSGGRANDQSSAVSCAQHLQFIEAAIQQK